MSNQTTQIWSEFNNELKAYIFKKTQDATVTDDVLQEVFMKIIYNMDKVNQAENKKHYVFGMVRNAISDYFRAKTKIAQEKEAAANVISEVDKSLNSAIADCCIRPFIQKLPEHYREAILLTQIEGLSQKELAEKLDISYSGAKSRVQRGKEKLKELLIDCCACKSDVYGNLNQINNNICFNQ